MPSLDYIAQELRDIAVSVETLKEDENNARSHDKRSIAAVKNSLQRFGQRTPIVIRNKTVIAGNARLVAARELGWTHIAAISADADDDNTAILYALADNRTAELSTWDQNNLATAIATLKDDAIDLDLIGWSDEELDDILDIDFPEEEKPEPEPRDAEMVERPEAPQTQPGDLILLGDHRLLCADSTKPENIEHVMNGEIAHACLTDPPYGTASESKTQLQGKEAETFNLDWDKVSPKGWIKPAAKHAHPGAAFIAFSEIARITDIWDRFDAANVNPLQLIAWVKDVTPTPRPNFCSCLELAVFGRVRDGKVACWNGGGATSNVFRNPRALGHERTAHPTQKPLKLWQELMAIVTNQGHIVLDPFLGSGTSIIAAENLDRKCYGIEIDPGYCDVIVDRWEKVTGKTAVRP